MAAERKVLQDRQRVADRTLRGIVVGMGMTMMAGLVNYLTMMRPICAQ